MKIFLVSLFSLLLFACNGDPYSGFGCIAPEDHPAVTHARSFSQERLEFLYHEVQRLRKQNADTRIEYRTVQSTPHIKPIPDNLKFLNAVSVRPNGYTANITLADCFDEHIMLQLSGLDSDNPEITISWAAGTIEKPYNTESQKLWPIVK